VHIVVLDNGLIEKVVAEALTVPGVAVLLGIIAGVLSVVRSFDAVHPRRGIRADLADVAANLLAACHQCPLLGFPILPHGSEDGGHLSG
jgi:hypothetical protein